ncbi:T9SS type A sorting domain-containing protein [Hymenobacter sp. BRD67]|uniref:T9SS type A sorting domain-containing protein n=1 Tax=Hymenobacter sp. BRD67 TaxID=2675877 RepID=UPI0015658153|nr:T9SS type A sorting domain-containing protein [Hymenobacter sp. BRD67]QKG54984.1 T9SS type A sorting domain-containing protein [Hymenobacter sp. BRD67]
MNATTVTATVPAGATSGNVTVTTPGGTSNGVLFTVTFPDLVVSTSGQTVAAGTYNSITVNSGGVATLGGAVTVNTSTTINSGGTLNTNCQPLTGAATFTLAAGGTLGICDAAGLTATGSTGAVQTTGTRSFSPDASYVYNGSTTTQVTGAGLPGQVRNLTTTNPQFLTLSQALRVAQVLTVGGSGNLVTNGQALTLLSSSAGTALLVNSNTGMVSGSVTVQRYLDGTLNANLGYRHLAPPVSGQTVAAFASGGSAQVVNPAYNSSPTPASTPTFPTVFGYDQSRLASATNNLSAFDKGWYSPTSLSDNLPVGAGYTVQATGGQTLSFTGAVASYVMPVSFNLSRGADPAAGWALVGNPFPSPLDFSAIPSNQFSNVGQSMYVFQSSGQYAGSYRSYVNGVGGGNPLIGMGQAFFVRVSTGQATGRLSIGNASRVTSYGQQVAVQRTGADPRPLVQLTLGGADTTDELYAYAQAGATPAFDGAYDAYKLSNPTGLNLSSLSPDGQRLSVDGRGEWTAATVLPLQVGVPTAGSYTLTAAQLSNLPAGLTAYLRDAETGQSLALTPGTSYRFSVSAAQAQALLTGRFTLQFSAPAPLATAPAQLAAQVSVFPNPAREQASVRVPAVPGASQVRAELLNALGQVVLRQQASLPASGTTLTLPTAELAAGVYVLRLTAGETTVTKRLTLQ